MNKQKNCQPYLGLDIITTNKQQGTSRMEKSILEVSYYLFKDLLIVI